MTIVGAGSGRKSRLYLRTFWEEVNWSLVGCQWDVQVGAEVCDVFSSRSIHHAVDTLQESQPTLLGWGSALQQSVSSFSSSVSTSSRDFVLLDFGRSTYWVTPLLRTLLQRRVELVVEVGRWWCWSWRCPGPAQAWHVLVDVTNSEMGARWGGGRCVLGGPLFSMAEIGKNWQQMATSCWTIC